ncbi:Uncharacterised protein [Vibrio cholerae]|nr:Uncharacterised protein [Vibrio cholerae]
MRAVFSPILAQGATSLYSMSEFIFSHGSFN